MFVVLIFSYLFLSIVLADEKSYDRRYDYFEVDYFVNNPRLLKKYLDCFLDQGPCTPIGRVFKKVLPEVIRTACEKCTPLQKKFTKKAFDAFKMSLPESHAELKMKYDPRNMYYDAFETAIAI
ncbi:Chemosensory protein 15 [Operophtera brumata]|uniref:Chemosensory protein 15 n=1 Tax=Operophtera brumata TaxID=104452 RepID=A0A0L7LKG3_OPEBR|nr:Chemosensory protein 15 [Operophtera brumata]